MRKLTAKQERFCQEIVIGQKPSEAYRVAFVPKKMNNNAISVEASRLLKNPKIALRIAELRAPVVARTQGTLAERLKELSYAAFLDPADAFDDFGRPLSIRAMPEHVRRAIAGYEVDAVSFVTKVKFVDKRGAIMDYSKLMGPEPPQPPRRPVDLSKLTPEERDALTRGSEIMRRLLNEAKEVAQPPR